MSNPSITLLLLVEDNPGDARLLREMFKEEDSFNVELTHVDRMCEAEKHLADHAVGIILLDLGLSDAQGLGAVRRAHAAAPRVPLVVLTGLDDESLAVQALQEGAQDYLVKGQISTRGLQRALRYAIERKTMEEALFVEKERAQVTLDCIGDAVACTDVSGHITFLNRVAERMLDWSSQEAAGRPMAEVFRILDAGSREIVSNPMAMVVGPDGCEPLPSRRLLIRRDGCEIPIEDSVAPIHDREGQAIGAVIVFRDVSAAQDKARQKEELVRALRESEERFRATFEQAAVGISHSAMDGRWLRVNQRCCDILGYTSDELLARTFLDVTHPDERAIDHEQIRRFGSGEIRTLSREKRFVHKNGSDVWVDLTVSVARDSVERSDYFLVVLQDITARKQLEQELLHAQRMEGVGQLAGGIAHDFNNLLTVIGGRSHLALAKLQAADPLRHDLELIQKTADRAAALTRQLLAFSRKQVFQPRVVDPNDVISGSTNLLKRLIGEDIDLVFVPAAKLGRVRVDSGHFEQVIVNLAVNARDAMPDGGHLTIETANVELDADYAGRHVGLHPGRYVMLAVSDTGVGMDTATRVRIFEPFFTTKGPGKGTGLGLATVYGIVKRSEGYLRVYSEVGVGTVFKIYLPRTDAAPEAEPPGDATLPRGTETILLVEDEAEVRNLAREVLESLGYTLLEAANAAEAVLIAERHVGLIELLLTDVVMPRMGGGALAEAVTTARPETKILFMSGYTDDAIVRHGILEEGVQLLEKPFTRETLAGKVRAVLDRQP